MPVDLRSDTVTKPTLEMRRAMAEAEVGDDVFGEDPTVNRLQEMAAGMLGKEAALFLPTGTMANEAAVKAWTTMGDAILLDEQSHLYRYELSGPAVLAGVQAQALPVHQGIVAVEDVERNIAAGDDHIPATTLLCLENTHNRSGGTVVPLDQMRALADCAHRHGMKVHLDGARFFNAALAIGVSATELAAPADSMMFCLSKGLGCPVGSLLLGPEAFITEAHLARKLFGGGMRQVGILAAAGIVALETMIDRLAEDHERARRLAEAIAELPGLHVDLDTVQTNIIYLKTERPAPEVEGLLVEQGVLGLALDPHRLRLVTHCDVDDEGIEQAIRGFRMLAS